MRTYIAHAEWMDRRNRPETIGAYARHVLNRMPTFVTGPERIPVEEPWWSRAAIFSASSLMQSYMKDLLPKHRDHPQNWDEVEKIYQSGWQRAVSELKRWKASFESPYHRSYIDRFIAVYSKMLWESDQAETFAMMRHCYDEALREAEANPCVLTGNQLLGCRVTLMNLLNNYRWDDDVENLLEEKQCLEFSSEHRANDLSMYTWFVFYKAEAFLIHGRKAEGLETQWHLQDICEEYGLGYLLPGWTRRIAQLAGIEGS